MTTLPSRPAARPHGARAATAILAGFTLLAAACGGESQSAAAAPRAGAAGPGAPGAPGGGPGGAGARPPLILAATDIAVARRGSIEAGIPLSGDLRPIQTVVVRARLEGDLLGVFVRPGQRVSQGQLLARFEASEQDSQRQAAEADRVSARSDVSTAQWNADQARDLFKAGAIPERDLRNAEQVLAAARARLAAADARVRATSSDLSDTRVVAPLTGIVESAAVQGNERVQRGAEMFTIVRGDVLELAASVPERIAAQVRPGQAVRLGVGGGEVEGKVARVSPTVDPATRAVTVFVEVPNAGGRLKGNTFATGRAVGRVVDNALIVPTSALRQAEPGASEAESQTYVYRIRGGVADRAPISVGLLDEAAGIAEVVDGLAEGDQVVVGNVGAVGRGTRIQIIGTEAARNTAAPTASETGAQGGAAGRTAAAPASTPAPAPR